MAAQVKRAQKAGGRVYAAAWVRPGRADDAFDARYMNGLRRAFSTRDLPPGERAGLPPEVTVMEITENPAKLRRLAWNLHYLH